MIQNKNLTTTVLTALLTAITVLCTLILKFPIGPECYIDLGDAIILLSVMILPRGNAVFVGAFGASCADLFGGFPLWAPATFIIKTLVVLVFGYFLDRITKKSKRATCSACEDNDRLGATTKKHSCTPIASIFGIPIMEILALFITCIIEVLGHFIAESIIFGNMIAAAACMPMKAVETLIAVIVTLVVSTSLLNTNFSYIFKYKRPAKCKSKK